MTPLSHTIEEIKKDFRKNSNEDVYGQMSAQTAEELLVSSLRRVLEGVRGELENMERIKYPIDTQSSDNKEIRKLGARLDDCQKAYNRALSDLSSLIEGEMEKLK